MKQVKDLERLDKVLSNNGFGTRKEVRHLIRSKVVSVNGEVITDFDAHIHVNSDKLEVSGAPVDIKANIYLIMNKPQGYVCSTRGGMHAIVYDLLNPEHHRKFMGGDVSTIGRLDVDTEGLLIFTSDGDLNHRITSPKWNIPKTYLVYLRDAVSEEQKKTYIEKLAAGMHIEADGKDEAADCKPAELEWKNPQDYEPRGENAEIQACGELTVTEGKFHEVKRLFAALGNEVVYLKRLRMNNLYLDPTLKPGEYRELTDDELRLLDVGE